MSGAVGGRESPGRVSLLERKKMKLVFLILCFCSLASAESMPLTDYETVAVSQTDQALGTTGASGDILDYIIVTVTTAGANGIASLKDGAGSAIPLVPSGAIVGAHVIKIGARSTGGAWKVTTGSAATAIAVGRFK